MAFLEQLVTQLQALGFYEFLLPWLLTFAVVYGLLVKSGVFGEGKLAHRVSGLIGIVAAFFVTPYAGPAIANYFATLFTGASTVLAGILVVVLFAAMAGIQITWGGEKGKAWKKNSAILGFIIIGIILIIISASGRVIGVPYLGANISAAAIFMIIVVVFAIAFVLAGGEEKKKEEPKKPKQPGT